MEGRGWEVCRYNATFIIYLFLGKGKARPRCAVRCVVADLHWDVTTTPKITPFSKLVLGKELLVPLLCATN